MIDTANAYLRALPERIRALPAYVRTLPTVAVAAGVVGVGAILIFGGVAITGTLSHGHGSGISGLFGGVGASPSDGLGGNLPGATPSAGPSASAVPSGIPINGSRPSPGPSFVWPSGIPTGRASPTFDYMVGHADVMLSNCAQGYYAGAHCKVGWQGRVWLKTDPPATVLADAIVDGRKAFTQKWIIPDRIRSYGGYLYFDIPPTGAQEVDYVATLYDAHGRVLYTLPPEKTFGYGG